MIALIILIVAFLVFLFDAYGVPTGRLLRSWSPLGYALWTLAFIVMVNPGGIPLGGLP